MTGFSNYLEAMIVNSSLRGTSFTVPTALYVGLFTADPTDDGNVNECAYSGYARQNVTGGWNAPSGADNQSSNSAQIQFPINGGGVDVVVTHFGIFDAVSAGNCLYTGALESTKNIQPGDQLAFAAGAITIKPDTV